MPIPLWVVDAFTSRPFAGNPAAVCLMDAPADPAWMQALAEELNLAETAFCLPQADGFGLRWFTPAVEVPLCGHATLATAHALWERGDLPADSAAMFHTLSGALRCERRGGRIAMDFPVRPTSPELPSPALLAALGVSAAEACEAAEYVLLQLSNVDEVGALRPDMEALLRAEARPVVVTAAGGEGDFVSRFFAPGLGVDEDPVTGSSHCSLAPFWAARLDKRDMRGVQISRRGGVVDVELRGDRVTLLGEAVTVIRGEVA
jgi:PhzF family phenazine biosynthesis protein